MQPVTDLAEMDSPGRQHGAPAFVRVAVLCRMPHQGARWASAAGEVLAADLVAQGLTHFEYFPIDYTNPESGDAIVRVFDQVGASQHENDADRIGLGGQAEIEAGREQPFDALVIAGGADLDSDIGMIHRVLAPGMREAVVPVLCAIGADDARTILGDSAWRVFTDPLRLLESIAAAVRPAGPTPEALCGQIRSLGEFLVTEQAIEARILRDAALMPALQRHVARHEQALSVSQASARGAAARLQGRLMRESGRLEQVRARLDAGLTQAQQRGMRQSRRGIGFLRITVLAIFLTVAAVLWWLTSPATTVFFSGCALVLLSAAYVGIGNRIADRET